MCRRKRHRLVDKAITMPFHTFHLRRSYIQGHVWFLTILLVLYTKIEKMDLSSIQNRSTRVSLIPPPRDGSIRAIRRSLTKFPSSAGFGFGVRPDSDSDSEFGRIRIRSSAGLGFGFRPDSDSEFGRILNATKCN